MIELDFLNKKSTKSMERPNAKEECCGIPEDKKQDILQKLEGVIPDNRKTFWQNLPIAL